MFTVSAPTDRLGASVLADDARVRSTITDPVPVLELSAEKVGTEIILRLLDRGETLEQLRRAGAAVITVNLPANDPSLASIGAGLDALALGFASFIPSFGALRTHA